MKVSHTFLSLDMDLIPQATKENVPTFWRGVFSNDKSRMILDGKNKKGDLVHPIEVLTAWTQWSIDPQEVIQELLSTSIEITSDEYSILKSDVNSIWYIDESEG